MLRPQALRTALQGHSCRLWSASLSRTRSSTELVSASEASKGLDAVSLTSNLNAMQGAASQVASEATAVSKPSEQAAAGPAEQADAKFSLGAAFLGAPPAECYAGPHEGAPEAWLLHFAEHHADAVVWSGLFSSCRGGRDFAVRYGRTATLTLRSGDALPADWPQQLAAVQSALSLRGALPTRLVVERDQDEDWLDNSLWVATVNQLFSDLVGYGQGITEAEFNVFSFEADTAQVLHTLAAACPNLRALSIAYNPNTQAVQFPAPSQWPKLTSLSLPNDDDYISDPQETFWPQIVPYLAQLTTLTLPQCDPDVSAPWDVLFPSHLPTSLPLTHFVTEDSLTDELLSKLLTHAPNLAKLSVRDVQVASDGFSDKEWGVGALEMTCRVVEQWSVLAALAWLPRPREGRMGVAGDEDVFVIGVTVNSQGIDASVSERLALWRFDVPRVTVQCGGVPPADQPAALGRTLRQLADMQAPDATVWLQGWEWPAVADTVAECLPLLPHLQFGVRTDEPLTDELLAVFLRMGPHMRRLSAHSLALQSDHSGVAWPWVELSVRTLDVAQLLRLPVPVQGAQLRVLAVCLLHEAVRAGPQEPNARAQLRVSVLRFASADDLSSADTDRLRGILSSLQCSCRRQPYDPPDPDQQQSLVARLQGLNIEEPLSLLRAMHLDRYTDDRTELQIINCILDFEATTHLSSHLPQWRGRLFFLNCTWPLDPPHYRSLAQRILGPLQHEWHLVSGHTAEVARSMCEGALESRRDVQKVRALHVFSNAYDEPVYESYGEDKVHLCQWSEELKALCDWPDLATA